jgi:hypothetical protein
MATKEGVVVLGKIPMEEDLQTNPLFQLFQRSEYWAKAAASNYMVVVPAKGSLSQIRLNREFLLTHILQPSVFGEREFTNLNGTVVNFEEKNLIFLGNPRRTVRVIQEELYYDDNYNSFKVLKVLVPLIGGVTRAYIESISNTSAGAEKRTIVEHKEFLTKKLNNGGQVAFVKLSAFADRFNQNYLLVKGYFADTGASVRDTCSRIRLEETKGQNFPPSIHGEIQLALECLVLSSLHSKLFKCLSQLYEREEASTTAKIALLRRCTMAELGVRDDLCQVSLAAPTQVLSSLNSRITPVAKLSCLLEANQSLTQVSNRRFIYPFYLSLFGLFSSIFVFII